MIGNLPLKCVLLGALGSLGACAGLSNGAPPVVRLENGVIANPPNEALFQVRTAIEAQCLNIATAAATAKGERNRLVTAYMLGIDLAYNQYERNLLDAVRENDLGASTASLALSTIGSVVGEQALAQALSTTNAIVTGTHTAIGRDYLFNQTLSTLQTQMRASRAEQRALILRRLTLEYDDWTSCTALSDVLAYEQAGTLNAALAAVADSAAQANRAGEAQVQAAIDRVAFTPGPLVDALSAYFVPDGDDALATSRLGKAQALLTAAHVAVPAGMRPGERLMRILDGTNAAELRALAIAVLEAEKDQAAKAPIVRALTQVNGG